MGSYGDRVRNSLLDAAEELFATHGIDAVSNRRIAEHSGNANHSAIAYHFGGRNELLIALLGRYSDDTRRRRRELVDHIGPDAGLRDLLSCLILPFTEQLAAMPAPSRRARFLRQLRSAPELRELLAENATAAPLLEDVVRRIRTHLTDVPDTVFTGRAWIVGRTVVEVCAEYETRLEQEVLEPRWDSFANFLIDACAGMLEAPVTSTGDFLTTRIAAAFP